MIFRAIIEGSLTVIAAAAFMVWFYNRYLSALRESYLKKTLSLTVLPLAFLMGLAHGWAVYLDQPTIWLVPLAGLICLMIKSRSFLRRRVYNLETKKRSLPRQKPGVNSGYYPAPIAGALRLIQPINGVDEVELVQREAELDGLHPDLEGKRIVFLSDFHVHPTLTEEYFREVIDKSLELEPDLLLVGGDFVSKRQYRGMARRCLKRIQEHPEVYAVRGNHDFWTTAGYFEQMLAGWNTRLLKNEIIEISLGEGRIELLGLEDPYIPLSPREEENLPPARPGIPRIGLVHTPAVFPLAERLDCQFAFAGHTHGGQIRLPFFGTTVSSCDMPERFVYGSARLGRMETLVTNGIGAFYPMRILCPPQIVEVTLRRRR